MPRFSLPKLSRLPPIFLLLIFILVVLAAEAGYYYFRVIRKPTPSPSETQRRVEEKAEKSKEEYEKLKQEIATQKEEPEERVILIEKCQEVYLDNPKNGIYRLDKIGENIFDYFYRGKLTKVEEKTESGCLYTSLHLKETSEFTLILPLGLAAKTDLGDVYPLLYQNHLGERVEIKIRLEQSRTDPKAFKIIEWQPIAFFVD